MNPSTLLASHFSTNRAPSSSSLLNPLPLRTPTSFNLHKRRQFRVSIPRSSSEVTEDGVSSSSPSTVDIFGGKKELTGVQPVVKLLPPSLRLATSAIVVAGAVAAGYGLGLQFGKSRNAALGGAAALAAASGAAVYSLNSCVPEVAAVDLHNYVAEFDDPKNVKKEEIENIATKLV